MEDSKGYLWFGTGGGGVSRYNGDSFTNFTIEDSLAVNNVSSILEDRKGRIWFGTRNGVISCYDGNDFVSLTEDDSLTYSHVTPLLEDREGNIWFGIYGTGNNDHHTIDTCGLQL
jgi:ligand-binding sensor domain-containing protein